YRCVAPGDKMADQPWCARASSTSWRRSSPVNRRSNGSARSSASVRPVDNAGKLFVPYSFPNGNGRAMGYRRFETLIGVARIGYWVRQTFASVHAANHNPIIEFEMVTRRGGSTRLARLHKVMKCDRGGAKIFRVEHCQGPEIWRG